MSIAWREEEESRRGRLLTSIRYGGWRDLCRDFCLLMVYSGNCIAPLSTACTINTNRRVLLDLHHPPSLIDKWTRGECATRSTNKETGEDYYLIWWDRNQLIKCISLCEKYYQNHHKSKRIKYAINLWSCCVGVPMSCNYCVLCHTTTNRWSTDWTTDSKAYGKDSYSPSLSIRVQNLFIKLTFLPWTYDLIHRCWCVDVLKSQ